MRIERLELDGFGRFADAGWDLGPGLTVLLGPNEAGKTTLLNGIRALLFGFEATREGRPWYPAFAGGRRGGRLVLVTAAGERWAVERHGDRGGTGSLTVRAPNGNTGGQETLDRLLAGVDRELFTNVFAFGLGELQSFNSLSGEGVRSRIYGAGSGLGGMSAADLERQLQARQEAVFRPRGRDQELNRLVARIEELRARIALLEQQPARFEELHHELATLAIERDRIGDDRRSAAEAAARASRIVDAQAPAAALAALDAELGAGDATLDAVEPGLDAELTAAVAARESASDALAAADRSIASLTARINELTVDERLLGEAADVAALAEERPLQLGREAGAADLHAARSAAEDELADLSRRAGSDAGWLLGLDDSVPTIQATREVESRLAAAETRRSLAATRVASLSTGADVELDEALQLEPGVIAERRAAIRALDELRIREALGERADAPGDMLLIVAGAALLTALSIGVLLTMAGVDRAVPAAILAGALAAAAAVAWRRGSSGRASLAAERARLLEVAALPADADADAVQRAGDALAAAGASDGRRAAAATRAAQLADARHDLGDAEAGLAAERAAWAAWLAERHLPRGASPDAARQVLGLVAPARRAELARGVATGRLEAAAAAGERFARRVDALLTRAGRETPPPELRGAAVLSLADAVSAARGAAARCAELRDELRNAGGERALLAERAAAATSVVARLLDTHRATDPAELRARIVAAGQRAALRARARELRARLVGIAGGEERLADLLRAAAGMDPATLDVRLEEARRRVAELDARGHELSTRGGALRAELAQLEHGVELGERRQELSIAEGRAAGVARTWAVRAITLRLLEETRHRYERERQPLVVQDATAYFDRITGGAYERIVAAPGEATVRVEPAAGAARLTDELSRGTAEQLYLALRFGLIEQFARSAEPLPVVMDDILVNFDADRASRAAAAIRTLAERHQVLYFTCHLWTAELLDPTGAGTVALD